MRKPKPATLAGIAVMATTVALLPLTAASAAFDDGDYSLTESCGIEATLKVRGSGNGISIHADTTLALATEKSDGEITAARIIAFGEADIADDNVVHLVEPTSTGIVCTTEAASDEDVAALLGIGATSSVDAYAQELSAEEAAEDSAAEDSAAEDSAAEDSVENEGVEKVELCHKPEGANPHEIEVSAQALQAHLDHGDLEGACPEGVDKDSAKSTRADDREAAKADRKAAKADREPDGELAPEAEDGETDGDDASQD